MNTFLKSIDQMFNDVQRGIVTAFGFSSSNTLPLVLQKMADTDQTIKVKVDLSTSEPLVRKSNGNNYQFVGCQIEAGNKYPSFSQNLTFGAWLTACTNNGELECHVVSKPESEAAMNQAGRTPETRRTYYSLQPVSAVQNTEATRNAAIEYLEALVMDEVSEAEPVEETTK